MRRRKKQKQIIQEWSWNNSHNEFNLLAYLITKIFRLSTNGPIAFGNLELK